MTVHHFSELNTGCRYLHRTYLMDLVYPSKDFLNLGDFLTTLLEIGFPI